MSALQDARRHGPVVTAAVLVIAALTAAWRRLPDVADCWDRVEGPVCTVLGCGLAVYLAVNVPRLLHIIGAL